MEGDAEINCPQRQVNPCPERCCAAPGCWAGNPWFPLVAILCALCLSSVESRRTGAGRGSPHEDLLVPGGGTKGGSHSCSTASHKFLQIIDWLRLPKEVENGRGRELRNPSGRETSLGGWKSLDRVRAAGPLGSGEERGFCERTVGWESGHWPGEPGEPVWSSR